MKTIKLICVFVLIFSFAKADPFFDGTAGNILPHLRIAASVASGEFHASEMNMDKWAGMGYVTGLIRGVSFTIHGMQESGTIGKDIDIDLGTPTTKALIAYNYFKENPEKLSESDAALMLEAFIKAIRKKNNK